MAIKKTSPLFDTLWLIAGLAGICITTSHTPQVADTDIWFHLRTGQLIITNHAVPLKDSLSSHAAGQPWIDYTWLFDVLVSAIYGRFGYRGILEMANTLAFAYTAWLVVFFGRFMNMRRAMILAFSATLAVLPMRTPRPWLFTILFFAIELTLLWIAREKNRPVWLLPIVPLFALWANIHIQFVYGLGLIGLFALELSLPARMRNSQLRSILVWALLAASMLATLANPYGWRLYKVVWVYASQTAPLAYIQEMQAMPFRGLENWLTLFLIGAAVFLLGRNRVRNPVLIWLVVVSCYFGFRSQRDVWFLVTVSVFVVGLEGWGHEVSASARSNYWVAIPLSFLLAISARAINPRFSDAQVGSAINRLFPENAARYIESHGLRGPLFNSFNWGGYLIWRLPGMPVSIDGRANLYEATLADTINTVTGTKNWAVDPDLRKAQTILLEQSFALASILRLDPRYRLLYEDDVAVVFAPR
jgi:hypothetical protein